MCPTTGPSAWSPPLADLSLPDRKTLREAFLRAHAADFARVEPLPADASPRRYFRLCSAAQSLILMDADPASCDDIAPFVRIAEHLLGVGLAAPKVHAEDHAHGFLLLEDLGPRTAAQHLADQPEDEAVIYAATAEALAHLQATPPPDLVSLTGATAAQMLAPLFDWYECRLPDGQITECVAALIDPLPAQTLSLRDLHAENIIWRPARTGSDRVGLLDFQDAWLAPRAYDLASLLDDPRRDVSPQAEAEAIARVCARTGADPEALAAERAILSVFARLIRRDGKPRYGDFLPRLRGHLDRQSRHPALARLRPLIGHLIAGPPPWL